MERRQYIKAAGAAVAGSVLAGCAASGSKDAAGEDDANDETGGSDGGSGSATGTLSTSVTDQPIDIDDFESCVVTIDGIWVKPGNGEADEATDPDGDDRGEASTDTQGTEETAAETGSGTEDDSGDLEDEEGAEGDGPNEGVEDAAAAEGDGRRYVEFDEPQEADLVRLQGANTQLIDETELPVGEYRYLQLEVSGVAGVLAEGGEAEVDVLGNAPLQFKERFEIRPNERTRFVADFAPVRRGQGAYLLRPVATGTRVLSGDEEYDPSAGGENGRDDDTDENDADDANGEDGDEREADGNRPDADEGSDVPDES